MGIVVWDLPVRLFHWLLAIAVAGAFISVNMGEMDWHLRFGFAAMTLVIFRVLWGLVGSSTARFTRFVKGPGTILAYLRGQWSGIGHNPLGALSVLALLGLVLIQVSTGLMSNDDLFFDGPWALRVGKDTSDAITGWHHRLELVLLGFIGLHLLAVIVHVFVKREPILKAMITGRREHEGVEEPRRAPLLLALACLGLAVFLTGLAFRFWLT